MCLYIYVCVDSTQICSVYVCGYSAIIYKYTYMYIYVFIPTFSARCCRLPKGLELRVKPEPQALKALTSLSPRSRKPYA